jgi:hypothetical protein
MMKRDRLPVKEIASAVPFLLVTLSADGIGQAVGHAFGLGQATAKLFPYEFHRTAHLVDKAILESFCES